MPTIHGYTNDDTDVIFINGVTGTNPAAVGFDSAIVKSYFYVAGFSTNPEGWRHYLTDQAYGGARRTAVRVDFLVNHGSTQFGHNAGTKPLVMIRDMANGRNLACVAQVNAAGNDGGWFGLHYNSSSTPGTDTWVLVGAAQKLFTAVGYAPMEHTLTFNMANAGGALTWHVNNALMASMTGDTLVTSSTDFDCVSFHQSTNLSGGWSSDTRVAEVKITSDDYGSYGLRVANLALTGAGDTANQDAGVYTDINEQVLNRATGMSFDTVGDGADFALADLTGATATSPVMGFRLSADVRVGASGPSQAKLYVRISGTNYYSSAIPVVGIGFVSIAWQWDLNPATSAPWTGTEINALKVGIEAA
jgi:hypothetical protein